ncbi:hypothetical protein, variant [Aphanomyces astaci]|uniref:Endoplasmic reticulum vesicle transporter C-terminal domain-containing protein n=1 Tax=Aphanomyces astaci TaxID=112090 RepID=W4G116_APHAT|nr:hypothetical protein, variant [Aphanomyces astaci]ETV72729.1 hypothetical protein, variant [Aphanomyces astaci]|eukprot:XP_009837957.1 hypothetical protein, variant [Aphanomyces astaci]
MFNRLRQYDVYTKGVDGIQEKTMGGAIITVISVAIVILLFLSELGLYTTTEVVNRMHVDTVPQDAVMRIEVDITFLHEKCADVAMDASDIKGNKDLLSDSNIAAVPVVSDESEGCRLTGTVDVHKVAGVVSFAHAGSLNMFSFSDFLEFNSSHVVHRLSFGPEIPNMVNPLENVHKTVEKNVALYKYGLSIVPTQHTPLYGPPVQTYQYSVTEYTSEPSEEGALSFPGVSFMYEFSPIKVEYVESKPSFLQFVTSTSAIVGGVFAVARIVDSLIYSVSSRKMD